MEQAHFYGPVTGESSYSFVLRCIELRQKILIASTKSDIRFDKPLLDKVFCRTLERGLSSTYVIQEIRHLLRTGVSDEELIFEVTKASAAEKERVAVQSKGKKTLRVNTVQEETSKELLKAVETLSNKLTALQAEVKDMKMGDSHGSRYRCNSCKTKGVFDCNNHCFKCGSVDHISRHCRKRQNQGN